MRTLAAWAGRLLDSLLLCLFVVMVAAIVWQVFARYVLEEPTAWSEELARYLMVWVTMLGSAHVIGKDGHVAVTVFVDALPGAAQRALALLRDALLLVLTGALAWYGYGFAMLGGRKVSTGLELPMTYPYLAIPVGAALIALALLAQRLHRA